MYTKNNSFQVFIYACLNNNEEMRVALKRLATSLLKSKEVPLQEKLLNPEFDYDGLDLFDPITKPVEDTSKIFFEESKAKKQQLRILRKAFV